MITERQAGVLLGKLIAALIAVFCGYATASFVTLQLNPLHWDALGRLVLLAVVFFVHPRLFSDEK